MPRTPSSNQGLFARLLVFALLGLVFAVRGRRSGDEGSTASSSTGETTEPVTIRLGRIQLEPWEEGKRARVPKRVALAAAFTMLFFAGAALTAGAGDQAAKLLDTDTPTTTASDEAVAPEAAPDAAESAPAPDPAPAEPAPAPEEPAADPAPASGASPSAGSSDDSADPAPATAGSTSHSTAASSPSTSASGQSAPSGRKATASRAHARAGFVRVRASAPARRTPAVVRPLPRPAQLDPEAHDPSMAAVVWLNRALPDPTPPAKRLTPTFASRLTRESRKAGANWALALAILRTEGFRGPAPATPTQLRVLVRRVAAAKRGRDDWHAVLALTGRTATADEAVALARYNRAVGIDALVTGLEAAKQSLTDKLLRDSRVSMYAGGRDDLMDGKIDVRLIVLIEYLAEAHGQITVSCLLSGHRLYARPGVISAHIYGHAVDISSLGGLSIAGHQEPGGLTETAVREILLLPSELQPRQVISLLGLGGPSFPLADHADHIHVGY
jgi:hypothetical protein